METMLQQRKEEKKYSSNQEEGFNPKLLRLGSPIPTPTPNDQESPIMFSDSCLVCENQKNCFRADLVNRETLLQKEEEEEEKYSSQEEDSYGSCSMCGSKKRKCLTPSFGQSKKTILIDDPSSMKEAAAAASSIDDERSPPILHTSSFLHQIPPNSSPPPPQTSPFLSRSVSDISSFALSGSFSSPKSTPNQTSSCPSKPLFSIPKSPSTSNPSNSPSYFDSPSTSSPKSSTATPPTDSVQKSDDQKPIGDGNYEQMQIVPWYTEVDVLDGAGMTDLNFDVLSNLVTHCSPPDAAKVISLSKTTVKIFQQQSLRIDDSRYEVIPALNKVLLELFAQNPRYVDSKILLSLDPINLNIDFDRLGESLLFNLVPFRGRGIRIEYFIESLLKAYEDVYRLRLSGEGKMSTCLLSRKFQFLKHVEMFNVTISSAKELLFLSSLEELQLQYCRIPSRFKLKFQNGASLQSFVMEKCVGLLWKEEVTHIILNVASLQRFTFHGWVCVFDISEVKNLIVADIQFKGITRAQHIWGSDLIYQFLSSLKLVQKLSICNRCMKHVRSTSLASKLLFPNLKELHLNISLEDEDDVNDLVSILTSVPILAKLSIKVQYSWFNSSGFWKSTPVRFHHLNYFRMEPFNESRMEFLGHILMNAWVLKKAEVVLLYGLQCNSLGQCAQEKLMKAFSKATKVRDEILALPRVSAKAEVIVILDEGFLVTEVVP